MSRPTIMKRMRERARKEKRAQKADRRAARAAEKRGRDGTDSTDWDDPDIAHIVPGPQPVPWDDDGLEPWVPPLDEGGPPRP